MIDGWADPIMPLSIFFLVTYRPSRRLVAQRCSQPACTVHCRKSRLGLGTESQDIPPGTRWPRLETQPRVGQRQPTLQSTGQLPAASRLCNSKRTLVLRGDDIAAASGQDLGIPDADTKKGADMDGDGCTRVGEPARALQPACLPACLPACFLVAARVVVGLQMLFACAVVQDGISPGEGSDRQTEERVSAVTLCVTTVGEVGMATSSNCLPRIPSQ